MPQNLCCTATVGLTVDLATDMLTSSIKDIKTIKIAAFDFQLVCRAVAMLQGRQQLLQ